MNPSSKQLIKKKARNIALVRTIPAIAILIIAICTELFLTFLLLNPQTRLQTSWPISILHPLSPLFFLLRAEWKIISIISIVLISTSYTYLKHWYQWVLSIATAVDADNVRDFTVRFMEEGFRTRVQFFLDQFPRRKFPDRIAFKETKITEPYGHKIPSKVYSDSINDEPFLIQTDKDLILLEPRWLSHPFSSRPY